LLLILCFTDDVLCIAPCTLVMKIAVEGCCHGELDKIYETLAYIEQQDNVRVDLLLICGDFEVTSLINMCI